MYVSSVIGFLIVSGLFFAIILDPMVYQYLDSRSLLWTATGTVGFLMIAYPVSDLLILPFTASHALLVPPFMDRFWQALIETPPDREINFQMSVEDLKIVHDMKLASGMIGNIKYIVLLTFFGAAVLNISKPLYTMVPIVIIGLFVFLLCYAMQTKLNYLASVGEDLAQEYWEEK